MRTIFARRGEVAVFNVAELAETEAPPIPWSTSYAASGGGALAGRGRDYMERRFAGMVDPFGGAGYRDGVMELPMRNETDPLLRECIEMGESGWTPSTGTLNVDCAHGRENAPLTGNVNRVQATGMYAERTREAGPMDNSSDFGVDVTARRPAFNPWAAPAGFEWFEHRNATLRCLFLESDVHPGFRFPAVIGENVADVARLWWEDEYGYLAAEYPLQLTALANCSTPFCLSQKVAHLQFLRLRAREALRNAYGWEVIRDYRNEVYHEMVDALASAEPYGYAAPRENLVAIGRVLGHGGNACVTGPGGTPGYVEAVIPSVGYAAYERTAGGTRQVTNTGDRGSEGAWYGTAFEARGVHAEGDRGELIEKHPDPVGRTTPYSEAELPPGVVYPEEMTRNPDYNNVRMGTSVWREFACGTAHAGLYGAGVTGMGPLSSNPRSFVDNGAVDASREDDWWRLEDGNLDMTDPRRRYTSSTPCVGDPDYDVLGADGTPRCYELHPLDPSLNTSNRGDRYVGGLGSYSVPAAGVMETGRYVVDYSGDGVSDAGEPGAALVHGRHAVQDGRRQRTLRVGPAKQFLFVPSGLPEPGRRALACLAGVRRVEHSGEGVVVVDQRGGLRGDPSGRLCRRGLRRQPDAPRLRASAASGSALVVRRDRSRRDRRVHAGGGPGRTGPVRREPAGDGARGAPARSLSAADRRCAGRPLSG